MKQKLNAIFNESQAVGLNVLIANTSDVIEQFTYGYASLEEKKPTDIHTIYRIASVSKVIVATCIMMLYDEGLVDIYEDISKYLGYHVRNPYFPNDSITLRMLMTQTSSICDGEDQIYGYDGVNGPTFFVDLEQLLTNPGYAYYTSKTYLQEKPGTKYCYSNFGCGILACIIEKVTGMYFTDFVRQRLFIPMGLDASFRIEDIEHKERIASLYEYENNTWVLIRDTKRFEEVCFPKYPLGNNFRGPAGGLLISPLDLSKIMRMLMNEGTFEGKRYLKQTTVQLMKQIHWHTNQPIGLYQQKGLQLLILDDYGPRLYGHTGSAYGLRSFMFFNANYGYICMCNGARYTYRPSGITTLQEGVLQEVLRYEDRNHSANSPIHKG
ncbi:MAG: beta-lactamase family protein [Prevotella sp.]|nr:beta-lactamase family protein [Staphylococcus sp.]MCM1350651.1 beta-lactamase family protein [Prevotella sp.]